MNTVMSTDLSLDKTTILNFAEGTMRKWAMGVGLGP
jgi:hypothetical protein